MKDKFLVLHQTAHERPKTPAPCSGSGQGKRLRSGGGPHVQHRPSAEPLRDVGARNERRVAQPVFLISGSRGAHPAPAHGLRNTVCQPNYRSQPAGSHGHHPSSDRKPCFLAHTRRTCAMLSSGADAATPRFSVFTLSLNTFAEGRDPQGDRQGQARPGRAAHGDQATSAKTWVRAFSSLPNISSNCPGVMMNGGHSTMDCPSGRQIRP